MSCSSCATSHVSQSILSSVAKRRNSTCCSSRSQCEPCLPDLCDVCINCPVKGDLLAFNGCKWTNQHLVPLASFLTGTGADGNVTIGPGQAVTLTRDMFFNNLTIAANGTLLTNGFRVFVSGLLTLNGVIANDGSTGTLLAGGAGGVAGFLGGGGAGGDPAAGNGGPSPFAAIDLPDAGTLFNGGDAAAGGGLGGVATAVTAADGSIFTLLLPSSGINGRTASGVPFTGGAGGGGSPTGGGGGGGGVVLISARRYAGTTTASIQALGGAGAGTAGGGAGGLLVLYGLENLPSDVGINTLVSGGEGGAGAEAGQDGRVIEELISILFAPPLRTTSTSCCTTCKVVCSNC